MTLQEAELGNEAALVRYFEDAISARRQATVQELGLSALAWLALPPIWTDELANRAGFPDDRLDRQAFLARCEQLGWCVRRPVPMASRREDAAEILTSLVGMLSAAATDTRAWENVIKAAAEAISQVDASALRRSLLNRLIELAGADTVRAYVPGAESGSPSLKPVDPSEQLISRHAWAELQEFLAAARPAQLQRIVLRHLDELPDTVLESSIRLIASHGAPRVASGILRDILTRLSRESARSLVLYIRRFVDRDRRGPEASFANLAVAAGYADDGVMALDLCDRLLDDRLRAQALGMLAGVVARDPKSRLIPDIVNRIARTIVDGQGVDLTGGADAVAQLAEANAVDLATPIIVVIMKRLHPDRLTAPDIESLVKLAASIRLGGHAISRHANALVEAAVDAADKRLTEPTARAAGLTRVLPVLAEADRARRVAQALSAARKIADATERARALSRLATYLPADQLGRVVNEIIEALQPAEPGAAFWVPDGARANILAELERLQQLPWLRAQAAAIGRSVQKLSRDILVPPAMRQWAELAATLGDGTDEVGVKTGQAILTETTGLLQSGLTTEALGWIETGRSLLTVIKGEFDTSLLIAARRVELSHRTADDRRLLQRFLPRREPLDAFRRLLATPPGESPWALHYLGGGGVGKTILLRHISAELAPQQRLIVARVDFDHLNPDFPRRRPGLLLLTMLEQLEVYASPETRELYEEASKVLTYQDQLPGSSSAAPTSEAMDDAIQRFCAYLQALDRRIVLILDTCEELARFESAGAVLPQVDAAFRLLERIHEELPSVLVIFAGRRPLAYEVHNGRLRETRRPHSGIPDEKPYLMVQQVTGFTEPEATEYLRDMEGLTLSGDEVKDLLKRSRSGPNEPDYDGGPNPAGSVSYIPFDLAQYAAALREDPNYLSYASRDLAYATYVRDRIADRLTTNAARLLPAVVIMRHFDQDMLGEAITGMGLMITSTEAWQELGAIEWISTHYDYESVRRAAFMEVDRTMLERLQAFFAVDQPAEYEQARRLLANGLAGIVRSRALPELTVDHVDAALRCLEPVDAADLCDGLSLRVAADTRHWMWAYYVFSRVLGTDGALAAAEHPAAASAIALHVTALSQVKPSEDLKSQWELVAAAATNHPRPAIARWLASRAAILADPLDVGRLADAMRVVREQRANGHAPYAAWLAGAILAAVGKATEDAGTERDLDAIADWQDALRELIGYGFASPVLAAARVLLARLLLMTGSPGDAAEQFRIAIDLTRDPTPAAEAAADGAIPDNVRDWVRFEAALVSRPETGPAGDVREDWLNEAVAAIGAATRARLDANPQGSAGTGDLREADPDSDRLAALLLGRLLDEAPVSRARLALIEAAIGTLPLPAARTSAQAAVPPLRVVLSSAWLALGDVTQAQSVLGRRDFAEAAAEHRLLDLARVEIARRMRLPKSDPGTRRKLSEALSPIEAPRLYEAMSLLGEGESSEPETFRPPEHLHAWWRAQAAPGRVPYEERDNAFSVALQWCSPDRPYLAEAIRLDHVENAQREGQSLPGWHPTVPLPEKGAPRRWPPQSDEELLRLGLRKSALAWGAINASHGSLPPSERLGMIVSVLPLAAPRRLAELALDEGELLALRVPEAGIRLLQLAREWFIKADDHLGALIAHTVELLASARSTKRGPEAGALAGLGDTYERARREIPALPSWARLETHYAEAVSDMPKPNLAAWEGWLLRLRWLLDGAPENWLGLDPRTTAIPPEIRIREQKSLVRQNRPGTVRAKLAVARQGSRQRTGAGHRTIVVGSAVLDLALLGWSVYNLTTAARGLPITWMLVAGLTVIAAAVGLHVMTTGPHKSWAKVEINPGPSAASVSVVMRVLASRRWHVRSKVQKTEIRLQMVRPSIPAQGQTQIHELLRETASPGHPLPVSLLAARTLVGVSWESWLGAELTDIDLRLQRPYLQLFNEPETTTRRRDSSYWVMSPPRWGSLISKALPAALVNFPSQFPDASPGDVLVIVAVAISTSAGRRLVVHNGESRHNDLIIDPDEAVLTDLTIVVAGEPRSGRGRASTPQSVAALRTCAADLIEAGARTVIVVPNAPSVVTAHVLGNLTESLWPGDYPSARDLSDAVAEARDLLTTEADRELGYELTVMSRTLS